MMGKINFQRMLVIALGLAVLGLGVYVWVLERTVEKLTDEQYVLPPDLSQRYIFKDRILKIYERDKNIGKTKVKKTYVPPEGDVDVRVSTSTNRNGERDVEIVVRNKGFTVRPGFGALYEKDAMLATVDAKLAYWSRASAGAGLTTRSLNLWGSYHLDWIPYWHPQNLELVVGRSMIRFDGDPVRWHLGFRVNF